MMCINVLCQNNVEKQFLQTFEFVVSRLVQLFPYVDTVRLFENLNIVE